MIGNIITIEGVNYSLLEYPLSKTVEIQDCNGDKLYEVVEDISGEYMDFYDAESELVIVSPHVSNFEGVTHCIFWFLESQV